MTAISPVKSLANLVSIGAESLGLIELFEVKNLRRSVLRVLTYHRIAEPLAEPTSPPGIVSATLPEFQNHLEVLVRHYRVVSMEQVLSSVRGGHSLPPRSVLITFDDAYEDFASRAWPLLRQFELPVTLFVATAYPGCPERSYWWDRIWMAIQSTRQATLPGFLESLPLATEKDRQKAYRYLNNVVKRTPHGEAMEMVDHVCRTLGNENPAVSVLSWEELGRLSREGVTLSPHTRTHPLMERIDLPTMRDEVAGSVDDLMSRIGTMSPVFAYPAGSVDRRAKDVLRELGIELAFTTRRGINDMARIDRWALNRINIGVGTRRGLLRLQLAGVVQHGVIG